MTPKISRVGGFTNATARGFVSPADALRARGKLGPYDIEFELQDSDEDDEAAVDAEQTEGTAPAAEKEEPWDGSSSGTSHEKPPKSAAPRKPSLRKPARTTAGPSESTEASGTAPTATTNGPVTGD